MHPAPCRAWRALAAGLAVALAAGCAARRPPAAAAKAGMAAAGLSREVPTRPGVRAGEGAPPPVEAPAAGSSDGQPPSLPPAAGVSTSPALETPEAAPSGEAEEPRLRDLCRASPTEGAVLDATRRRLEQTFCSATLWFDGLLGGEPDIENARAVSGRVELSNLYTQAEGHDPKARLRVRYDLPNLERRVSLFFGREDRDQAVADRLEGAALRSSVFGLEQEDDWLAGLGYSPPGRWASKVDFRVGGKVKTAPEVFVQGRYRRNTFVGDNSVWRFRETLFWENREGLGTTTSLDLDYVLDSDLVFRFGNVGTYSESTEGLAWRSAVVLYHHLGGTRAIAGEAFWRGSTDAEILVREYGLRGIYRQPLGAPYLFGELIAGYTWPRFERDEPREGSATAGLGIELHFGRDPD